MHLRGVPDAALLWKKALRGEPDANLAQLHALGAQLARAASCGLSVAWQGTAQQLGHLRWMPDAAA